MTVFAVSAADFVAVVFLVVDAADNSIVNL